MIGFIILSLLMEIPDLNFKTPATVQPILDVADFYSFEASQFSSEKQQSIDKSSYKHNFQSIIEDQIQKKTMNVSWHSRYFCLTPTRILYYESDQKRSLKGCFNLASLLQYSLQIKEQESKLIFLVRISSNQENNEQEQEKQILILNFEQIFPRLAVWKEKINQALSKIWQTKMEFPLISAEQIRNPHLKIHGDNYWNRIYLTNSEMVNYVNQLDIIFFRSKSPMASFHRFLMRSNFDHVGILLKDSHNRLLVLEAIESRGVWINQWKHMLPTFREHYEEIAIKKLVSDQLKIDLQMLETYLDAIIGKKYELSFSKLFIGQSSQLNSDWAGKKQGKSKIKNDQILSETNLPMKQKTFFCSELIADIFIKCGFIKGKKRNEFWPRDFEGDNLQLESHVSLSPLMYLSF